jgi:HSP20 family protein
MEEVKVSKQQPVAKSAPEQRPAVKDFAALFPCSRWFGVSPFALVREFSDEMDRALRGETRGMENDSALAAWYPALDVHQCAGSLVITAELPGLKKDEVKVEVNDDALVIQGERQREHKEDHQGYHRWERSYGHFYRSWLLPEGAKTDQVKAELQDGLLTISVPVPQSEEKAREVPIETRTAAATATNVGREPAVRPRQSGTPTRWHPDCARSAEAR